MEIIGKILTTVPKPLHTQEADFSHIELTDEEIKNAINYFKMLKQRQMDEAEKVNQRNLKIAKAQQPWTYDELKADVLERAEQLPFNFVIDKENELVFHQLCLYFSNDKRIEEYSYLSGTGEKINYSLSKVIALISKTKGSGKSILMHLFARNKKRPFFPISTLNIAAEFKRKPDSTVDTYSSTLRIAPNPSLFYCEYPGICFEDLGMEDVKNSYGNKVDVMRDVLFKVYENCQKLGDFSMFHFTSNLLGSEFENRYDERIRSRMREMFNMIELPGKDRRK